jgi:uncharacterized protein with von Willebrand factor type A (vWA) domain
MSLGPEAAAFGPWVFILATVLAMGATAAKLLIDQWGKQQVSIEARETARQIAAEQRENQRYTERQVLTERMMTVIESNTAAMQALRDQGAQTASALALHDTRSDARSERIEKVLNDIQTSVRKTANKPSSGGE